MKPIIELKNLTVVYDLGKSNETVGVKDINLEIYPGEYIIFFGPSGCGKSTILYTIAGLETPTSGDVLIHGENLRAMSTDERIEFYRKTIGMVFQAYYLLPHLNAKDNIMLPQIFAGATIAEREARVKTLIERFDIGNYADRKPSRMSGGQQQRTAIARSLVSEPSIVLADEPVGNLDSKNAQVVLDMLLDINIKEKKTIIYVTHNPRDLHYAHRVFYLKDGVLERMTRNAERGRIDGGTGEESTESELERLAEMFPSLAESRLQAKLMLNSLLGPYDFKTLDDLERAVERYITGKVNKEELLTAFRTLSGGHGLYFERAHTLSERVAALTADMRTVQENRKEGELRKEETTKVLRHHLLDAYTGSLTAEQAKRLSKALEDRVALRLTSVQFDELLDKPIQQGGVGLNWRTARTFAREADLVLMDK